MSHHWQNGIPWAVTFIVATSLAEAARLERFRFSGRSYKTSSAVTVKNALLATGFYGKPDHN